MMIKSLLWSLGLATLLVACDDGSSGGSENIVPEDPQDEGPVSYGENSIYLRGDMNGWLGAENLPEEDFAAAELMYDEDSTCYHLTTEIAAGEYQFKIASKDWVDANIGGFAVEGSDIHDLEKSTVVLGTSMAVNARVTLPGDDKDQIKALPDPKNLILVVDSDAEFTFDLCFPTNDANAPELTVN